MIQIIIAVMLLIIAIAAFVFALCFFKTRGIIISAIFSGCALYAAYLQGTEGFSKVKEGKVDWGECKEYTQVKVIRLYEQYKYYDYEDKCEKYGPIRIWAKGQWRIVVDQPKGRVME